MKKILLFILLCFSQINYGQGGEYNDVYPADVISPVFNGGGMEKFNEYVNKEFDYSKVTKEGKLEAAFTIDEEGNVTNIRIIQILDMESATEFIRVLKKCPKWQPAKQNGKPFSVKIKYPMVFNEREQTQLENKNDEQKPLATSGSVSDKIYEMSAVEAKPYFGGGLRKFYEYIGMNFRVPEIEGLKGKVLVSFVVETDGSLTDIEVLKHIGYGTKEEAIRVLKKCPKWNPATHNGVPVRCVYSLPISIQSSTGY